MRCYAATRPQKVPLLPSEAHVKDTPTLKRRLVVSGPKSPSFLKVLILEAGRIFGPFYAPPSMRPWRDGESNVAADDTGVEGVAGRYASALFDLATESGQVAEVETQLTSFQALLDESADLVRLVRSPVIATEDQERAISAILDKSEISGLTANFLKLIAKNRRLFAISDIIKSYRAIAAKARGEVTAEVTSAVALNDDNTASLKETLKAAVGKDVTLVTRIDPSLLGGLIVKVGSRMIDSSLRTKLQNLKVALGGAGA